MTNQLQHDPRYEQQQLLIARIAHTVDSVAYLPDYHGKVRDPNTVLLYTKEDADHNRKVDMWMTHYSLAEANDLMHAWKQKIDPKYIYRDYFWSFENTDVNGCITLDFGNRGTIDFRKPGWEEALRQSILAAYAKYKFDKIGTKGVPPHE